MSIISPLPFTLQNGTTADASEVMADLNQIRDDVNQNAANGGQLGVPSYKGALVIAGVGGQTLLHAASNILIYNGGVTIDTNSIFNASFPTRLTVPSGASIVRLIAQVTVTAVVESAGRIFNAVIRKNGTDYASVPARATFISSGVETPNFTLIAPILIDCVPGDYFEVDVTISRNTDRTISSSGALTWFEMQILG